MAGPEHPPPSLSPELPEVRGAQSRHCATGEVLVRPGDSGGPAFWVETGCLEVVTPGGAVAGRIHQHELVGEVAALTGSERSAMIRACEPTTVRVLSPEVLEQLLSDDDRLSRLVRDQAVRRAMAARVRESLAALLPPDSGAVAEAVIRRGDWRRLGAGDVLFRAGEPARSAFLVVSGRLRPEGDGQGYCAAGSVIGEEGLAGGVRRVTVAAIRDTALLELSADAFLALLADHPREVGPMVLGLAGGRIAQGRVLDRSIAVAVTAPVNPRALTSRLADQLQLLGSTAHLWGARVDAALNRPGIAQSAVGGPGEIRLLEYLGRVEQDHRYLLLEPDSDATEWSSRALRHADVLAVVASADPGPDEEAHVAAVLGRAGARTERVVILLQAGDADRPVGAGEVLRSGAVEEVLHIRAGSTTDLARVARTLAGRPSALVLGGGGARGFAGLGVYRAMHELGIPIDAVGATSIGAPLGAGMALGVSPEELVEAVTRLFRNVLDYTLPVVSLLKGERTAAAIRERFDGWRIEDLWLPFFCVSTNLTQGRSQIHRSGDIPTALRASVAIPGAFPPVPLGDDLLVDGGVTNNLPVDVMRERYPNAEIVALQVAPARGPRAKADYGLSVSGWQAVKSRVGRGPQYPGLIAVLMRSMITGSLDQQEAAIASGAADLLLDLDLRGVGLLDFDRVAEVAAKGYDAAMPRLVQWLSEREPLGAPAPERPRGG